MATIPTATEIFLFLNGYGINGSVIDEEWVEENRDNFVIPYIENAIGYSIASEQTITEYHSGNNTGILFLNRKYINSLETIDFVSGNDIVTTISTSSIELLGDKGVLKAKAGFPEYYGLRVFPKGKNNIKVSYKIGGTLPKDLAFVIKCLTSILILDNIEGRTGGGDLGVQGFNRSFGTMGRYTNIRKRLKALALTTIKRYGSSVVGS